MKDPLVSINILSFNRKIELYNTLAKVFGQGYENIEVIVVDNASTNITPDMVEKDFPEVKIIKLDKNIGIAGWNEGFKEAKGEYILVLDDDSYPDYDAIRDGVTAFNENFNLGIVAYQVFNTRINKLETIDFKMNPYFFVGCGALIKRSIFNKIGYYNDLYFIYYHELDFSARCYEAGYEIIYLSSSKIFHNQSLLSRGNSRKDPYLSEYRYKHYFISYSIFLFQRFYLLYSFLFFLKWLVNRALISLRYKYFKEYFQSIMYLLINSRSIIKGRKKLKKETQEFYNYGNMPFIEKGIYLSRNSYG